MALIRADKLICDNTRFSRSEIKELFKTAVFCADGQKILSCSQKIDENSKITVNGETLITKKYIYLMMNKPKGYISTTEQKNSKSVLELVPEQFLKRRLFPAGRLDKDTTGFLFLTDDGDFAHRMLSPKNHVKKEYTVQLDCPVTEEMINGFKNGVVLFDGTLCLTAELHNISRDGKYLARVILKEGMYHQIKRMFGVYNAGVTELRRTAIGDLPLDPSLSPGECREITQDELLMILTKKLQ